MPPLEELEDEELPCEELEDESLLELDDVSLELVELPSELSTEELLSLLETSPKVFV